MAFLIFHGLVWASFLVIAGVMLAFRRRMVDYGAAAPQLFAQDMMPLLAAVRDQHHRPDATASHRWMSGYGYEFLAILHAIAVIVTLLRLPFGKLFHIFQRPAQLGVSFYKDAGSEGVQADCRRCGAVFAPQMTVRDCGGRTRLGFTYEAPCWWCVLPAGAPEVSAGVVRTGARQQSPA